MRCSICDKRFRASDIRNSEIVCEVSHRSCSNLNGCPENRLNRYQIPFDIIATQFQNTQEWVQLLALRRQLVQSCAKILRILREYQTNVGRQAAEVRGSNALGAIDLMGHGRLGRTLHQLLRNDERFNKILILHISINRQLEEKNVALDFMRQQITNSRYECSRLKQSLLEAKKTNRMLEKTLWKFAQTKKRRNLLRTHIKTNQELVHRYSRQCFIIERVKSWDEVDSLHGAQNFHISLYPGEEGVESVEGKGSEREGVQKQDERVEASSSRITPAEEQLGEFRELRMSSGDSQETYSKAYIVQLGKHLGVPLNKKDIDHFYICHNGNVFVRLSSIKKCDEFFEHCQKNLRCVVHPCGHKIVLRRLVPLFIYAQVLQLVGYRFAYDMQNIYVKSSLSKPKICIKSHEHVDYLLLKRLRN